MKTENLPKNSLQEYMLVHFDWLEQKLGIVWRQLEWIVWSDNPFNDLVNWPFNFMNK